MEQGRSKKAGLMGTGGALPRTPLGDARRTPELIPGVPECRCEARESRTDESVCGRDLANAEGVLSDPGGGCAPDRPRRAGGRSGCGCVRARLRDPRPGLRVKLGVHSRPEGAPEKGRTRGGHACQCGRACQRGVGRLLARGEWEWGLAGLRGRACPRERAARARRGNVPRRGRAGAEAGRGVVARCRGGAGRQGERGRGARARAAERAPAVTWAREGGRERAREGGGWGG